MITHILKIQFNDKTNEYELWKHHYNFEDKLYPLLYSYNLNSSKNRDILIGYAKRKYPEIYNQFTIISEEIILKRLPNILR